MSFLYTKELSRCCSEKYTSRMLSFVCSRSLQAGMSDFSFSLALFILTLLFLSISEWAVRRCVGFFFGDGAFSSLSLPSLAFLFFDAGAAGAAGGGGGLFFALGL